MLCAACRSDMLHNIWSWFSVTCTSRGHKRKHESYYVVDSFDVPILSCMHKFQRLSSFVSCLLYFYSINTICPLKKKDKRKLFKHRVSRGKDLPPHVVEYFENKRSLAFSACKGINCRRKFDAIKRRWTGGRRRGGEGGGGEGWWWGRRVENELS